MPNAELLAEHNRIGRTAVTPEEMAAIGHLRGDCHDGSVCPLCRADVHYAHTVDDMATELAALRRARNLALDLLATATDAHRDGVTDVTAEYLDRAIGALGR